MTSNKNRRNLNRIDYKIFNETGEKVPKNMATFADITLVEAKVDADIKDFFVMFKLKELVSVNEISEGLETATLYSKKYRDAHTECRLSMGEEYEKNYPKSEEVIESLRDYIRQAKQKLRDMQEKVNADKKEEEKLEKMRKEKERKDAFQYECDFFLSKLERKLGNFDWCLTNGFQEISSEIKVMETSLDEWYALTGKMKGIFGDDENKYEEKFQGILGRVSEKIEKGKLKIKEIIVLHEENTRRSEEEHRVDLEKKNDEQKMLARRQEKIDRENKFGAKNLYDEILLLSESLKKKCEIDLTKIEDYQLLELKKNVFNYTSELREIMDKITSFSKLVAYCGEEEGSMMDKLSEVRAESAKAVSKFSNELGELIRAKDISEEKLKTSLNLKIELKKFKGYESEIDIYTFRAEFEKLIEPLVRQNLWAYYLKKNYLSGSALTLVETLEDINKIWETLIGSFGNMKLLLQNKISSLDNQQLWKVSGDEKMGIAIASLLNIMFELVSLAQKFGLEEELYYGGCFEKILSLLGYRRERKFISKCEDLNERRPKEWERLVEFLQKELELCKRLSILEKSKKCLGIDSKQNAGYKRNQSSGGKSVNTFSNKGNRDIKCLICDKSEHVTITNCIGREEVPYFACKKFVEMTNETRRKVIFDKKFCAQCLEPGVKYDDTHKCSKEYICPDKFHEKFKKGLHVLVCSHHKDSQENQKLIENFRKNVVQKIPNLEEFSKTISCYSKNVGAISVSNTCETSATPSTEADVSDNAIFMLQTIRVEGKLLNLFFDSGCGDMVIKKSAVDFLLTIGRARLEFPGPITLSGVGDQKSVCEHGAYSVSLPLQNGRQAILSGLCLDKVTAEFPTYHLQEVTKGLKSMRVEQGGNALRKRFPKMPKKVGGQTDIIIGIKYLKYFPVEMHKFPSGLSVSQSVFLSADGSDGVYGGPHPEFTKAEKKHRGVHWGICSYMLADTEVIRSLSNIEGLIPTFGVKSVVNDILAATSNGNAGVVAPGEFESISNGAYTSRKSPRCAKVFDLVENAGTEISYRCVDCRNCPECKKCPRLDNISRQEEVEQSLINRSVFVDIDSGVTTAVLPFLTNPDLKLIPNENLALKVYKGQAKKLSLKPEDRLAVVESENKMQKLGFVDYVENLNQEQLAQIEGRPKYFIPWRVVWNENSVSTGCRLIFDGTQSSHGGCSLNSLLAKGVNSMNKLLEIVIRWTVWPFSFHCDIQKMYNTIFLKSEHWRYQMYLWRDDLDVERPPHRKVIKTAIYGLRPSGNLAQTGLRQTAEKTKNRFPRAHDIIMKDMYVDDCLSGAKSYDERLSNTDELKMALEKGGFSLKGFTFSGHDPPEHLSNDGKSVTVGGLKWFPKEDLLAINVGEVNFAKKYRGRKTGNITKVPEKLTKRICVSKLGEVFDLLGRAAPLISGMKLDISELHLRKLDWDDQIPDDLRRIWISNFELIEKIGQIRYHRAVVPSDALNLDMETIDTADASKHLICCAIYARFKRKNGSFSCQLIFARTKVLPRDISVPRAELMAATLNAITGHVVKLSLGEMLKKTWKLTDSQVALHWIGCTRSALKMWVRNRVVEINRLADASLWRYVDSKNMCADLGTRKGVSIDEIGPQSEWIQGKEWMRGQEKDFPVKTIEGLIMDATNLAEVRKESIVIDCDSVDDVHELGSDELVSERYQYPDCNSANTLLTFQGAKGPAAQTLTKTDYSTRYKFSKYILDPLKYRFRKVVRVLGLVYLYISKLRKSKAFANYPCGRDIANPDFLKYKGDRFVLTTGKTISNDPLNCAGGLVVILPEEMIKLALGYYFRKATEEIFEFIDKKFYEKISVLKEGVLYYSGRILSTQKFGGEATLCDSAMDLTSATFCVPLADNRSPISCALVNEIHWYNFDVKHGGTESVLRQVQRVSYIIGGRQLVKAVKGECCKCRILEKRAIKVAMGPVQDANLCIAPAFYTSQVDICGHFTAYSNANKRAKIKVWFVVFCCCATGAVDCGLMEDYSTDSFVLAFIRFSCKYGYPKKLLPDEGSQLVKGCKDVVLNFSSLQHKLNVEYGVEFKPCPVGAHYMHGKVERKIQQIKKSINKELNNHHLSVMQWETLGSQIANSINNLPIGLGNKCDQIENLDILTPNRLILGRNNDRCPTLPLEITYDQKRIVAKNAEIFKSWFNTWLVSYVPTLIDRPKWFKGDRDILVGDVVLFLKGEKEFDLQYQYGIVTSVNIGRDGCVRTIQVEYQNYNENTKRRTIRGVRDIIVIHKVDEIPNYSN